MTRTGPTIKDESDNQDGAEYPDESEYPDISKYSDGFDDPDGPYTQTRPKTGQVE